MTRLDEHRAIIETSLADHGLTALTPAFVALIRPCLRLTTKRATVAVGRSKLGGAPDLPASVAWPELDGVPMTFLGQVALDEAAHHLPSELPAHGLLSFFHDLTAFHQGRDVCRVVYSQGLAETMQRRTGVVASHIEECAISFVLSASLPCVAYAPCAYDDLIGVAALTEQQRDDLVDWRWNLDHDLGFESAPDHQLLGYPVRAQCDALLQRAYDDRSPAAVRAWRNLLSIDSDEETRFNYADGGTLWWLIEDAALRRHDFTRVDSIAELG